MSQQKKKLISTILSFIRAIIIIVLVILGVPYQLVVYSDETIQLTSLTYSIVFWEGFGEEDSEIHKPSIYFYPDHKKSYEELWALHN